MTDTEILEAVADHLASCPRTLPIASGAAVMIRQIFARLDEYTEALREMARRKKLEADGG